MAAAARLVAAAYPAIKRGREALEAQQEIATILPEAVARMLCESTPEVSTVQAAAERVIGRLQQADLPGDEGMLRFLDRAARKLRLRRRRIPNVVLYGDRTFDELLVDWMADALRGLDASEQAACPDGRADDRQLATWFPDAFMAALSRPGRKRTAWRTALIDSVMRDEERRAWLRTRRGQAEQRLAERTGLLAGGAAFVAAAAAGADLTTSLAAAGAGGIAGGSTVYFTGSGSKERLRRMARCIARRWIDDLAAALAPEPAEMSAVERIHRAWAKDCETPVPRPLLDALEGHVRRAALDVGDRDLAAALLDLHDTSVRATRTPQALSEAHAALDALASLITP